MVDCWVLHCLGAFVYEVEEPQSSLAESSSNALSSFIAHFGVPMHFPAYLSGSGFLGDKIFFSLSLMVFGGQIGNICDLCFVDFLFLAVVSVWAGDFVYIFPSLDFFICCDCF